MSEKNLNDFIRNAARRGQTPDDLTPQEMDFYIRGASVESIKAGRQAKVNLTNDQLLEALHLMDAEGLSMAAARRRILEPDAKTEADVNGQMSNFIYRKTGRIKQEEK